MTTPLVPGLSFDTANSFLPSASQLLLITDHLAAPADFILHRALALHLKHSNPKYQRHRAVLVSLASDFGHWRAIAAKSNVNLQQHMKAGSLAYVDGLSLSAYRLPTTTPIKEGGGYFICPPLFSASISEPSLKGLYNVIAQSLWDTEAGVAEQIVILDDITLLEHIGAPIIIVTRFIRAIRVLCHRRSAALVIRAHASPSFNFGGETGMPFDSDLLRALVDACQVHVEVRPLASGRSGAVSGEIAVHKGGLATSGEGGEGRGRRAAVQYRLGDGGAVFFQRGMGAGVL
ncbi:hypothetical protein K439DRAFT_1418643 [Ramaria rubella]|nr:hypothetical protein K439DRAFT_1418643 [Ramaria rubella]